MTGHRPRNCYLGYFWGVFAPHHPFYAAGIFVGVSHASRTLHDHTRPNGALTAHASPHAASAARKSCASNPRFAPLPFVFLILADFDVVASEVASLGRPRGMCFAPLLDQWFRGLWEIETRWKLRKHFRRVRPRPGRAVECGRIFRRGHGELLRADRAGVESAEPLAYTREQAYALRILALKKAPIDGACISCSCMTSGTL